MFSHTIAVASNVDHMTVMHESVNERGRNHTRTSSEMR